MRKWLTPIFASLWVAIFSNYAFAPYSQSYLVWLAPWGLFFLESQYRGQYKKLFWLGCLVAIVFYSFSFNWIIHMTVTFGGFPMFLAIPIFIGSAVILNLWFPLFLILFSLLVKKVRKEFAWIAGLVCLIGEFGTPQVFPWYWGSVVAGNHVLAQTAEYFSVYGLSFLLFVVSYILYSLVGKNILNLIILQKRSGLFRTSLPIGRQISLVGRNYLGWALLVFFFGLGSWLYVKWNKVQPEKYVDTLMIQPNAPLEFRDGRSVAETMNDLMNRIERLTLEGQASHPDPVDLVVLPESAVPFFSTHKHSATTYPPLYWEQFDSLMFILANRLNANVFFNELDASYKDNKKTRENLRYYNSSTVYDPNGIRKFSYQKVFLLIFGEYMPFEFLYTLSPQTGRFEPGTSLDLLPIYKREVNPQSISNNFIHPKFSDLKNLKKTQVEERYKSFQNESKELAKFLPLICYEVIIPEFVRQFRESGNPDFFVNVTNDKWYGISAETFQHGDLARIRSIEWRKWMVRSTNSGSSFFVDHLGRVVDEEFTGQERSEFLRKKVGVVKSDPTFYVLYGNILTWLIIIALGIRYGYFGWIRKAS